MAGRERGWLLPSIVRVEARFVVGYRLGPVIELHGPASSQSRPVECQLSLGSAQGGQCQTLQQDANPLAATLLAIALKIEEFF